MPRSFDFEKREFIRLKMAVPVRYKLLSHEIQDPELDRVHEGMTQNIGAGGLLLAGKIPDPAWIAQLLTRRMYVGVNIFLPSEDRPIKALCRVAWASALDETNGQTVLGLEFQEITSEDRDTVTRHMIKAQMPG